MRMKFVMSYSCGKDSTLALHKMIAQGHEPVALITMVNRAAGRSYFHGADDALLREYQRALGIPFLLAPTTGEEYHLEMEKRLREAIMLGAEAACFGDIDIEGNRAWCEERCEHAGIESVIPLWHRDRAENVRELVSLGYRCLIKIVNNTLLPKDLLGRFVDVETMEQMERCGVDVCGENGEYHTLTVDGAVFRKPLAYQTGEILDFGDYSVIDVWAG